MNNTFDINRFARYFGATVRIGSKKLLMGAGLVLGILLVFMVSPILLKSHIRIDYLLTDEYFFNSDPLHGTIESYFFFGLYTTAIIAASLTFVSLKTKEGRISWLMLPASQTEKYLTRWLICVPLAVISYILVFEVADLIRCLVTWVIVPESHRIIPYFPSNTHSVCCSLFGSWGVAFSFLVALQGVFLLGSILWPKNSVIKTALALFACGIIYFTFAVWMSHLLLRDDWHYDPDKYWGENGFCLFVSSCNYALTLICWVIAYFRLKEIEIIQRW